MKNSEYVKEKFIVSVTDRTRAEFGGLWAVSGRCGPPSWMGRPVQVLKQYATRMVPITPRHPIRWRGAIVNFRVGGAVRVPPSLRSPSPPIVFTSGGSNVLFCCHHGGMVPRLLLLTIVPFEAIKGDAGAAILQWSLAHGGVVVWGSSAAWGRRECRGGRRDAQVRLPPSAPFPSLGWSEAVAVVRRTGDRRAGAGGACAPTWPGAGGEEPQ